MVTEAKQVAESAGILGPLGVDVKLFIAQLVNVGVVLFVMWRWVYKPLLKVMGYVEANALRAGLVAQAEDWKWSAVCVRSADTAAEIPVRGPVTLPMDWRKCVNRSPAVSELVELRTCVWRGRPFGDGEWVRETAKAMGLERTLRNPWRPRRRLFA